MLVRQLTACLAALMVHAAAGAQEAERETGGDLVIMYGMWPAEGDCTPENTTPITFADLLRDKASFADKCVSTVAWLSGRALFLDRDDLNLPYSNSDKTAAARRVGLYGPEHIMGRVFNTDTTRARVVGKLWDCEDLQGSNVVMVMGYCHYTGGPIIGVTGFQPIR